MIACSRLLSIVLLAGAALVGAAGCGGDTLKLDPVAKAAENTKRISTMHISMRMKMTVPGLSAPVAMTATGGFDNVHRRGSMSVDMTDLAKQAAGTALADPALWRGEQVFDFGRRPILYMRFPFLTRALPGGKEWIRIDLQLIGEAMGLDFGSLLQSAQNNPAQQLDYLRAVSGDLDELGTERVRGVQTTHYRTTVDLREYPKLVPEDQRDAVKETIDQLIELTGVSSYPIDVWLDSEQLVRRMAFDQTFKTTGGATSMTMTMDYFDFGKPVHVKLPSPSETADFSELIRGAQ